MRRVNGSTRGYIGLRLIVICVNEIHSCRVYLVTGHASGFAGDSFAGSHCVSQ